MVLSKSTLMLALFHSSYIITIYPETAKWLLYIRKHKKYECMGNILLQI